MIAAAPSCRVAALLGLPAQTPGAEMPNLPPKEENPGASTREPHLKTLVQQMNGRKRFFEGFNQIISEKNVIGSFERATEAGPPTSSR